MPADTTADDIAEFLAQGPFAVVGASTDRSKYGNKVLRAYLQAGRTAYCVHPREAEIEGQKCYRSLADLPEPVRAISVVTPPAITEQLIPDAYAAGVQWVWMQPGAESPAAIEAATSRGMRVLAGGPCALVALRYREQA